MVSKIRSGVGMSFCMPRVYFKALARLRRILRGGICRFSSFRSDAIVDAVHSVSLGAMSATIVVALGFHSVAHDPAAALRAGRGKGMDGAFEAVENVGLPGGDDLERLVVVVPADFARRHGFPPLRSSRPYNRLSSCFALCSFTFRV